MNNGVLVPIVWGLVVLVAVLGGYITKWLKMNLEHERHGQGGDTVATELRDSMKRLEARVANLERAVTTSESERKFSL